MSADSESRRRLYGFILFSVIEETIIAIIAFVILLIFFAPLLIAGMVIVAIGLALFTVVKIYFYWSSAKIPVYDPLKGQEGYALTDFQHTESGTWEGMVMVLGENWRAQASESIAKNARVWVLGITGLTLLVDTQPRELEILDTRS